MSGFADYGMFSSSTQFTNSIKRIGNYLVTIYKSVCPVDTGTLQKDIKFQIIIGKENTIKYSINIGENTFYVGITNEPWRDDGGGNRAGKNPNLNWVGVADEIASSFLDLYLKNPKSGISWLKQEWDTNKKIADNSHAPKSLDEAFKKFSLDEMEIVDE